MATLVDELALLAYDDASGVSGVANLHFGFAGAVLLELAVRERIDLADGKVRVIDPSPIGEPLLDQALAAIAADKPRKPKGVVDRLARGAKRRTLDDLAARGLMREERDRFLGIFPFRRYRPRDAAAKAAARHRLATAVDRGRADEARSAALASLVYALNMERTVFPDRKKGPTRKALKAIGEGAWASEATRAVVEAARAALMAAIAAATAASASEG